MRKNKSADATLTPDDFGLSSEQTPIEASTLSGDIRDVLLTHVRSMTIPWAMLSEHEQRDKIYAISECGKDVTRRAIQAVAIAGFPSVLVSIGSIKIDKGLEIKLGATGTVENITRLAEHGKQAAVLVLVEAQQYFGERAAVAPDKDQPDLPLDETVE